MTVGQRCGNTLRQCALGDLLYTILGATERHSSSTPFASCNNNDEEDACSLQPFSTRLRLVSDNMVEDYFRFSCKAMPTRAEVLGIQLLAFPKPHSRVRILDSLCCHDRFVVLLLPVVGPKPFLLRVRVIEPRALLSDTMHRFSLLLMPSC